LGVDDLTVDGQNCNRIKVLLQERYADIGVRTCLHGLGSEQIALDTFVEGIDLYDAVTLSIHGAQFHEAIAVLMFYEIGDVGGVSGYDRCGDCDYDCCEGDGFEHGSSFHVPNWGGLFWPYILCTVGPVIFVDAV
jgi:hypothetical protein